MTLPNMMTVLRYAILAAPWVALVISSFAAAEPAGLRPVSAFEDIEMEVGRTAAPLAGFDAATISSHVKDMDIDSGHSVAALVQHSGRDPLAIRANAPGDGSAPAPGTHEGFAALMDAWAGASAHCPET